MHKGYYALLGVSPTASASEIKAVYRRKGLV
jgi:curved DNA-binding protein CbpA